MKTDGNYRVFMYTALLHPDKKEAKEGLKPEEITKGVQIVLARNMYEAFLLIGRQLPESVDDQLHRLKLVVWDAEPSPTGTAYGTY